MIGTSSLLPLSSNNYSAFFFYNKDLAQWEKNRRKWLQSNDTIMSLSSSIQSQQRRHAVPLNVDDILDIIFTVTPTAVTSPTNNNIIAVGFQTIPIFPRPVPLPQMLDILEHLWEAERLDV